MAISTTAPMKRAIVRRLRSSSVLKAALKGGVHQSVASRRVRYPFVVYTEVSAPFLSSWTNAADAEVREIHALFDIVVYSLKTVEAENLDQLIDGLFSGPHADHDLQPYLDGQRVLLCRRLAMVPLGPTRDGEGRRVVPIGGTVEIWTTQTIAA